MATAIRERARTRTQAEPERVYFLARGKANGRVIGVARPSDPATVAAYRADEMWAEVTREAYLRERAKLTGC